VPVEDSEGDVASFFFINLSQHNQLVFLCSVKGVCLPSNPANNFYTVLDKETTAFLQFFFFLFCLIESIYADVSIINANKKTEE